MKVLEAGSVGLSWSVQHRCTGAGNKGRGCNALLEVQHGDLRYFAGTGGSEITWGYKEPAVCFKCPCCGMLTDLKTTAWPPGYQHLKAWSKTWQEAPPSNVG